MISRLSASAIVFAVLATTGLAFAADASGPRAVATVTSTAASPSTVVVLPTVEIVAHRKADAAR